MAHSHAVYSFAFQIAFEHTRIARCNRFDCLSGRNQWLPFGRSVRQLPDSFLVYDSNLRSFNSIPG